VLFGVSNKNSKIPIHKTMNLLKKITIYLIFFPPMLLFFLWLSGDRRSNYGVISSPEFKAMSYWQRVRKLISIFRKIASLLPSPQNHE